MAKLLDQIWLKFVEGKNTWGGGDIGENLFGKFMKFYGQRRALKSD